MATLEEEEVKEVYPPVELPVCAHLTTRPTPDQFGAIVTIAAGCATSDTVYVHEGLLKHYSSYFRTALKKEWAEGQSKIITLAENSPKVLRIFFNGIYTGKLFARLTPKGKIPLGQHEICEVYVFGDARGIPEICNGSVDLLFQKSGQEWLFYSGILPYIYDNTLDASPLRKYITEFAAEQKHVLLFRHKKDAYPKDFLFDVLELLRSRGEEQNFYSNCRQTNTSTQRRWSSAASTMITLLQEVWILDGRQCISFKSHRASTICRLLAMA